MSTTLIERLAASPLFGSVAPAGEHRAPSGAALPLATAEVGGRRILLAETDSPSAADALAVAELAESVGMLSLTVAGVSLTGTPRPRQLRGGHAVVGSVAPPAAATLEASGLVLVGVDPQACPSALLTADNVPSGVDLAALLLSYLPAPDGVPAVYEPLKRADLPGLGTAADRNAVATLFAVADDALRVLPGRSDELVLAIARVHGAPAAVISPQRLVGERPGPAALGRLEMLLRVARSADLPVVVLGGIPEPAGEPELLAHGLRAVADAATALRRPLVLVADDAERSSLDELLASVSRAITLDPTAGVRAGIASWLHVEPA